MESVQLKRPRNPCEKANFLAKIFFTWVLPIFQRGYKNAIKIDDIYEPLSCDRSESLGNRLEENWIKSRLKPNRSSLLSVILATFWKDYALLSFISFCNEIILRLGQPFLLSYLLKFFRNDTDITYHEALMYASGIVILNAFNALFLNHTYQLAFHNAMKVRVAVCSLIYRKSLRLSQKSLGETSPGKMVNLLSNDVNRFDWASYFYDALWLGPLLTLIVACLIWNEIGFVGLIGMFAVFITVPILSYCGKLTSQFRLRTALKTDERVRFMDEIISAVQVIKMYTWEKPFAQLISDVRKRELKTVRKASYIRALMVTSMLFTTRFAVFCTMVAVALVYGPEEITAARIFTISIYFSITSFAMSLRFARGIAETSEVRIALQRLQTFLELEEKNTDDSVPAENHTQNGSNSEIIHSNAHISMKDVTARWDISDNDNSTQQYAKGRSEVLLQHNGTKCQELHSMPNQTPTLDKLNIEFQKGQLIGVIGPVGAGKSSLLQVILRELPAESGSIRINGTISYASQEPWIFAASVRRNILFGQEYDRDRYNAVVKACALTRDFEQFENGDLSMVGERGASLSGGQKARINLARACYREADIYLLDDPLSAVDAHVGSHIFEKCIGPNGRLAKQKATRILVTHQVHFLREADWLIVLKNGKIEMCGTPADLWRSDDDFIELVGIKEPDEIRENAKIFNRQQSETLSERSTASASIESSDAMQQNEIKLQDQGVQMEASSKGTVKGSITLNYFKAGAHWTILLVLLFSFLFVQFIASAIDYWVSVWIKQEKMRILPSPADSSLALSTNFCIYVQASLVSALLVFTLARSVGFFSNCVLVSQNIHNMMFNGLISTSIRFFDLNPSGRILNRFSRDLGAIDEFLPKSLLDAPQNILIVIGSIALAAIVNPYFLLPVTSLTVVFLFIRKVYLKTSKELKRFEAIAKSPSFTHLAATLNGLSTVRAYNNQEILRKEFDALQDTHSACWFVSISTTSLFAFSMDAICTIFIGCIIFYYMLFETDTSSEQIGLAVSQAINLTGLVPWSVRQSADVINQMTSVERLLEYRDLEPEKHSENSLVIRSDWPSEGDITFQNVFYRYFTEAEPVLRNLSFEIKSKEKIGIVGRTGAGKSSLVGALFRLACVEGDILIDGINTANIRLSDLRKQIAIIPQDPVLFSGTLRRNLDPFEEYSDADIWSALEYVELKKTISETFGLQSSVLPRGTNYSVGQRQLLCLARAILRNNHILVLDEATANLDPQTDALIQNTIRANFAECTVLTVAHRLQTIIDCDRVIVMDAGKMVEFDGTHHLLQNYDGIFYGMVKALGQQEFDRLSKIALNKYSEIR